MKLKEIVDYLDPVKLINCEHVEDRDFNCVFACDLMSDVLAAVNDEGRKLMFITGLANTQTLRTAEMLDIDFIVFVRGKQLSEIDCALAIEKNIAFIYTNKSMYETCGILYSKGLKAISI